MASKGANLVLTDINEENLKAVALKAEASVAGVYGIDNLVDYSMTKGAVISFTRALAKVVANKGVTVNCVSPGSIDVTGGYNKMEEH